MSRTRGHAAGILALFCALLAGEVAAQEPAGDRRWHAVATDRGVLAVHDAGGWSEDGPRPSGPPAASGGAALGGAPPASPTDSLALVGLFQATGGANWTRSDHWLQGPVATWFGITLDGQGRVSRIDLVENGLAGPIPAGLQADPDALVALESLALTRNALSGPIPAELAGLGGLRFLYLIGNDLSGPIPPELGALSQLEILELGDNALTGSIPVELANLGALRSLYLSGNQLTGMLPPELAGLTELSHLSLSRNQFTGEIPAAYGHLRGLQHMALGGNSLSGPLPSELGGLDQLLLLDLNDNAFSGPIPASFGGMSSLYFFTAINNALSGPIPPELGQIAGLEVFQLPGNALSGPIPDALSAWTSLRAFNLWGNQLSGPLPAWLGNASGLEYVQVFDNQFEGPIPPTLGGLEGVFLLHLANNQFSGAVPPELGDLPALEALYLDRNPLEGPLPLSLVDLGLLHTFWFSNTALCEPADAAFQDWLAGIQTVVSTGLSCSDPVSIADARAQPPDAIVTVEGVLTRLGTGAGSAHGFLQDATAAIRVTTETDAPWGGLAPGTAVRVTGRRFDFRGVAQIAPTEPIVEIGQGSPVVPQAVTLPELEANLDAYESEIVSVSGLRLASPSGPFQPETAYALDGTAVGLFVFDDSGVVGEAQPPGRFTFVGPVGEFDTDPPSERRVELIPMAPSDLRPEIGREAVAQALGLDPGLLLEADFGQSDLRCAHIFGTAGAGFPIEGDAFLALSSGFAALGLDPNNSSGTTGRLDGWRSPGPRGGTDLCQLRLVIAIPPGETTFGFDFKFMSEEFPKFVGSSVNDGFLVERGGSTFVIADVDGDGNPEAVAPDNVVFDAAGQQLSINTTGALGFTVEDAAGTTYDGATTTLSTSVAFTTETEARPVSATVALAEGEESFTLVFSVFDVGDNILDTAVFVDDARFGSGGGGTGVADNTPPTCEGSAAPGTYMGTAADRVADDPTNTGIADLVLEGLNLVLAAVAPPLAAEPPFPEAVDVEVTLEDPASPGSGALTARDGDGNQCVFEIQLEPVQNQPPTAAADVASTPAGGSVRIDVLANDTDPDGDALAIASVSPPAHGEARVEDGAIRYTPVAGFVGTDGFTYVVGDGRGGTDEAAVAVEVTRAAVAAQVEGAAEAGRPLAVAAAPTGFAPTEGRLFFRPGGDVAFASVALAASGGAFRASVPASAVTPRGVDLYVTLSDGHHTAGFPHGAPDAPPLHVGVAVPPFVAPVGRTAASPYRMVSVPLALEDARLVSLLGDDFGAYDPARWRVLRWDAAAAAYVELNAAPGLTLARGGAVWLATTEDETFDIDGGASAALTPVTVRVGPGWHQIASPYAFPVAWASVGGHEAVTPPYAFNGAGGYEADQAVVDPWGGYFVENATGRAVDLVFHPVAADAAARARAGAPYRLRLEASAGDPVLRSGVAVGFASAGRRDLPEPPPVGDGLQLRVLGPQGAGLLHAVAVDGGEGAVWEVEVGAPAALLRAGPLEVRLQIVEDGARPDGYEVALFDAATGLSVVPSEGEAVVPLTAQVPARRLALVLGTAALAEAARGLPEAFALLDPFPNPSRGETTLAFALPDEGPVRLEVFDTLGRRVAVLAEGAHPAGRHAVVWGAAGLASGTYLCRLQAGDAVAVRSFQLVR